MKSSLAFWTRLFHFSLIKSLELTPVLLVHLRLLEPPNPLESLEFIDQLSPLELVVVHSDPLGPLEFDPLDPLEFNPLEHDPLGPLEFNPLDHDPLGPLEFDPLVL